jgi:hypothetical protein
MQPVASPKPRFKWWELDFLVPYRDIILVIGFLVFEAGIFTIPKVGVPVGLMTTGAGLVYAAYEILRP